MERARMASSVEKVDSVAGASQHREAARPRQLRASLPVLVVAVFAAARLAAQQEPQRVVRGLSFEGNHAIDRYALSAAIATTNSSTFATSPFLRWIGLGEKRPFNELEFRRDVVRLLLLYRQSGYMNAVIDTVVRRAARDVYVTFRIYEGDPVRLSGLDLLGVDSILDAAALKRALPLQVGDPFDRARNRARGGSAAAPYQRRGGIRLTRLLPGAERLDGLRFPRRCPFARSHGAALQARGRRSARRGVEAERVPSAVQGRHVRYRELQRHVDAAPAGVSVAPPHGQRRAVRRATLRVQRLHPPGRGREPGRDVH